MSTKNNRVNVPEAKNALNSMKYEVARELGINLKEGYNGDLSARENGYVGGYMVKKMIEDYERANSNK
ncbi:MAG: alpha/beta-type small acid-soluble spore protein [Clostridiales bacterium]|nr:alpha/beta-type small acid-soluble spore protein [Clostridiales bacterium]